MAELPFSLHVEIWADFSGVACHVTELLESGADPAPCSRAIPTFRMEAKRHARDEIAMRQRAADEKPPSHLIEG